MTYCGKRALPTPVVTQATDAGVVVREHSRICTRGAYGLCQKKVGVVTRFLQALEMKPLS